MRPRRLALALCLLLLCAACSGQVSPRPPPPPAAPAAPLHDGPLSDYVPAPSLRWLVLAEPRRIAEAPGFLPLLRPLIDGEGFDAFAAKNGFDLRSAPGVLVAGFDLGTLYVLPAEGRDAVIAERFRERLLGGVKEAHPHPRLTRITGVAGATPESLLRADDQLVAIATGDPQLVRVVEGYLLGRFRKTPSALRGAALAPLGDFAEDAPLRIFFPGPFGEEDVPGVLRNALLGTATSAALAVSFRETPEAAPLELELRLALCGDFGDEAEARSRLEDAWTSITAGSAARWFGLHRPLRPASITASPDRLELSASFDAEKLLTALYGAARAELAELFPSPISATDPRGSENDARNTSHLERPKPMDSGASPAVHGGDATRETEKDSDGFREP